ncbi:MAG: phosphatase PAP2-related protein [Patescibacteria group bacterium]|nr:phosphatase PAP2-related protein [Patescibacteria group bacterium]
MKFGFVIKKIKRFWGMADFRNSTVLGLLFFIISMILNHKANVYLTTIDRNAVGDFLLDILPVVNIRFLLVEGALFFILMVIFLMLRKPRRIPFILKGVALFVTIRAGFLILTHLGPYPGTSLIDLSEVVLYFASGLGRFFSGHTGMPFLFCLMFWDNLQLRILFLISSIIGAITVLLAHVHYSIDVVSAYFITYTIFCMAKKFFERDYEIFKNGWE